MIAPGRGGLAALALAALVVFASGAAAWTSGGAALQRRGRAGIMDRSGGTPDVSYDNLPQDADFTFARIRFEPSRWGFGPHAWGLDLAWNHDYPRADQRLPEILALVTGIPANQGGSSIVALTDPELFDFPWAYLCEVGYLTLTEEEVAALRAYLLKGGFIVVDDFTGYAWYNFEEQVARALPGLVWQEIDEAHPIFHTFFEIDDIRFGGNRGFGSLGYGYPRYLALFEDNDPDARILMIANYDNDIGEYWERSSSPYVAVDLTNDAYKLGVNYVLYSMLH